MTGTNKSESIAQWADIVIKMWEEKIVALKIWDEGALFHSFVNHINSNSGGDVSKIEFMFKQYGIYVDIGVGKETFKGNSGSVKKISKRREAKPWYSKVFFREVMKLREQMAWRYGQEGIQMMTQAFNDAFDQRVSDGKKTVSSLKTVVYRDKNNARWNKNYNAYGFNAWKSRRKGGYR